MLRRIFFASASFAGLIRWQRVTLLFVNGCFKGVGFCILSCDLSPPCSHGTGEELYSPLPGEGQGRGHRN